MTLTPDEAEHLRWLLGQLLPNSEEAEVVFLRHSVSPALPWRQIGHNLGMSSIRVSWLYRKGLSRLRQSGRLLSGLLLESPCQDR